MALGATVYVFTVNLADADRGIYETLEIRAAQHPSETPDFLLTRLLAYCLEYQEGIVFSRGGVSDRDEPTLFARDLTGALTLWVEIGVPAADRLHQASKACQHVAVYCHKDARLLVKLREENIYRAETIDIKVFERGFLDAFVRKLDRRMTLDLTISEGHLYCSVGDESFDCKPEQFNLKEV